MKRTIVSAVISLIAVAAMNAAPLCTSVLGSDVLSLNPGGGCELGPYLFNNFQVQDAAVNGGGPILLTGTIQNPAISAYTLIFNPQLAGPTFPQDLHFAFGVSSLDGVTQIWGVGVGTSGAGGSTSHVQENVCTSAGVNLNTGVCTSGGPLASFVSFPTVNPATGSSIVPQLSIVVWKDINSDGNGNLTQFSQTFSTPEPTTSLTLGAGLAALALLLKRGGIRL